MILPGILASGITGNLSTNNFTSIATATVDSSGAPSITFSSIPSTYTHLQVRYISHDSRTGVNYESPVKWQFNNDTASNYSFHQIYGYNGTVYAYSNPNVSSIWTEGAENTNGSAVYGGGVLDILDYTNTSKTKTTRFIGGNDVNGYGLMGFYSGAWYSTNAINSITITPFTSPFLQYTTFALYGVK